METNYAEYAGGQDWPLTLDQIIGQLKAIRDLKRNGDTWVMVDDDVRYVVTHIGLASNGNITINTMETPHDKDDREEIEEHFPFMTDDLPWQDEPEEDDIEGDVADELVQEYREEGIKRW